MGRGLVNPSKSEVFIVYKIKIDERDRIHCFLKDEADYGEEISYYYISYDNAEELFGRWSLPDSDVGAAIDLFLKD